MAAPWPAACCAVLCIMRRWHLQPLMFQDLIIVKACCFHHQHRQRCASTPPASAAPQQAPCCSSCLQLCPGPLWHCHWARPHLHHHPRWSCEHRPVPCDPNQPFVAQAAGQQRPCCCGCPAPQTQCLWWPCGPCCCQLEGLEQPALLLLLLLWKRRSRRAPGGLAVAVLAVRSCSGCWAHWYEGAWP